MNYFYDLWHRSVFLDKIMGGKVCNIYIYPACVVVCQSFHFRQVEVVASGGKLCRYLLFAICKE